MEVLILPFGGRFWFLTGWMRGFCKWECRYGGGRPARWEAQCRIAGSITAGLALQTFENVTSLIKNRSAGRRKVGMVLLPVASVAVRSSFSVVGEGLASLPYSGD